MNKDEALKMAIEALEGTPEGYSEFRALQACKEALAQPAQEPVKSKTSKYLGLVNIESEFPLTEWERKEIIKYSMECLLEEGELGKLGMLCHKFEETIRYFENKNPVKEFLNNKALYTHPAPSWQGLSNDEIQAIMVGKNGTYFNFARAIEAKLKEKNGIGVSDE
jgi:hypothetical protein